jgi:hypothetical protein
VKVPEAPLTITLSSAMVRVRAQGGAGGQSIGVVEKPIDVCPACTRTLCRPVCPTSCTIAFVGALIRKCWSAQCMGSVFSSNPSNPFS